MTFEKPESPLREGNNVLIRTVTLYHVGCIEKLTDTEVVLSSASWVASTGRFHDALRTGELESVEPFSSLVSVNRGAIVDVTDWMHALPTEQR